MLKTETIYEKHILIVDDDETILSLISRSLSDEGFQVTKVNNSTEALFILASNREHMKKVDLLITDFNMPKLTGLALIDELRMKGIKLPSLLISGNLDETMVSDAKSRDCIGFLKKPFDLNVLIGIIRQFFLADTAREGLQNCGI